MRRLKLGVLANKFFDPELGRMGGFGWAARQVARCFADPALGVDVVYLTGELRARPGLQDVVVHRTPLIPRQRSKLLDILRVRAEKPDPLLKGILQPDCSSLGNIARASRWLGRPLLFASPAPI